MTTNENSNTASLSDYNSKVDDNYVSTPKVFCRPSILAENSILYMKDKSSLEVDHAYNYYDIVFQLSFDRIKYDKIAPSVLYKHIGKHK